MSSTRAIPADQITALPSISERSRWLWLSVPWYAWCTLAGITSVMIGAYWDISWHISIGRDSFWTPAHIAIYLCGVLAGLAYGYLIAKATFSNPSDPLRAASVNVLGLHGPLGAFISGWGGLTMLVSAPFDNWWHDAYGLDVKIVSPPHLVLFAGIFAVQMGTLVFMAGLKNRPAQDSHRRLYRNLFLYVCGVLLVMDQVLITEFVGRQALHMHQAYVIIASSVLVIVGLARLGTDYRWAATWVCSFYTLFRIGLILILPLFPAEPKLGPVFHPVTHFIPLEFPLLILIPAFLLDLFWQRTSRWPWLPKAAVASAIFVVVLAAVQWPFTDFLQSPLSRNWFFGTDYMGYATRPDSNRALHRYFAEDSATAFAAGLVRAWAFGWVALILGESRGAWLKRVQR